MDRRGIVSPLILIMALSLISVVGLAEPPDTWVLWESDGNSLIAYGGAKDQLQAYLPFALEADEISGFWDGRYLLTDETVLEHGEGSVVVKFSTIVDWGNHLFNFWREVSGLTATYWTGSHPQVTASEIEFSESWTFRGLGVSLHVPAEVGASVSGKTVLWSAIEDNGEAWGLVHTYSGISAQSSYLMTSVIQTSAADFFFESGNLWVTVVAHASKAP